MKRHFLILLFIFFVQNSFALMNACDPSVDIQSKTEMVDSQHACCPHSDADDSVSNELDLESSSCECPISCSPIAQTDSFNYFETAPPQHIVSVRQLHLDIPNARHLRPPIFA